VQRNRIYQENAVKMTNSLKENNRAEIQYTNQEETFIEWWHNKFEKESKMIKQFEKDNKFYLNKKVWNKINEEGIYLKYGGKDLSKTNFKSIKQLSRRGINVRYRDMLKIRKLIEYSMIDSIDKGRTNIEYILLMKEMRISNRIANLES
jgi:hypothetical protein